MKGIRMSLVRKEKGSAVTVGKGAATIALLSSLSLLVGCATAPSTSSGANSDASSALDCSAETVSIQTWNVGASGAEDPMNAVAEDYMAATGNVVEVNSVNVEVFRSQLPTYVSSDNPPDGLKWLAGSTSRGYAEEGLLLDVSDVWSEHMADFPAGLKTLSTDSTGKQYFIPTNYYWWGVFYRPSLFEENGYSVPTTWDEFVGLAEQMDSDGLTPFAIGTSGAEWVATAWFDYLNLRINGAQFHRELLEGKHSFTGPEVREVFKKFAEIQPYFDPNSAGQEWQAGLQPLYNKQAGMTLMGGFLPIPEEMANDIDFFAFPTIDPSIPRVEEAPTDGFFASAKTDSPECTKEFFSYLASAEAQLKFIENRGAQIAANPSVPDDYYSELTRKGREHLAGAADITQFYDRDSSQEFATPANAANARFIAQGEAALEEILSEWNCRNRHAWAPTRV
jgi:multiple sugar transport system substrate-binding protein